uniref:Uncharacterized protein n=1 Tax=Rhizophora mucronata TaxID=61149 RepID=A0A2P2NZD8_RHIMU
MQGSPGQISIYRYWKVEFVFISQAS